MKDMPELGSGRRFSMLEGRLKAQGSYDPKALAAWIGRKKYGRKQFQKLTSMGKEME